MNGARPPLPGFPRAPIADIISPSIDSLAQIYSMFRIRKGYTGFCRRVKRSSDNTERDIGFTAGGFYNIKEELLWANGSDTTVTRWYNQGSGAGGGFNPTHIFDAGLSSPLGSTSGAARTFAGYPCVFMQDQTSLRPDYSLVIQHSGFVSSIWIGGDILGSGLGSQAHLYSVNSNNMSSSLKVSGDTGEVTDSAIFGTSAVNVVAAEIYSGNSIVVATSKATAPLSLTYNVNGASKGYRGAISGVSVGIAQLFGEDGENNVHTFIVDGSSGLAIRDLAISSFNADNWIY